MVALNKALHGQVEDEEWPAALVCLLSLIIHILRLFIIHLVQVLDELDEDILVGRPLLGFLFGLLGLSLCTAAVVADEHRIPTEAEGSILRFLALLIYINSQKIVALHLLGWSSGHVVWIVVQRGREHLRVANGNVGSFYIDVLNDGRVPSSSSICFLFFFGGYSVNLWIDALLLEEGPRHQIEQAEVVGIFTEEVSIFRFSQSLAALAIYITLLINLGLRSCQQPRVLVIVKAYEFWLTE